MVKATIAIDPKAEEVTPVPGGAASTTKQGTQPTSQTRTEPVIGTPPEDLNSKHPNAFKIGDKWLVVPPQNINVVERDAIMQFPTLRTMGSPKIRSGRQEVRIDVTILFSGLKQINDYFRPIYCQLFKSPFNVIENGYVRDCVKSILTPPIDEDVPILPQDKQVTEPEHQVSATTIGSVVHPLGTPDKAKAKKNDAPPEKPPRRGPKEYELSDERVPVLLRQISLETVPGFPQSVRANISFILFNHIPFSSRFEFLKYSKDVETEAKKFEMRQTGTALENEYKRIKSTLYLDDSIPYKKYYYGMLEERADIGHAELSEEGYGNMPYPSTVKSYEVTPENYDAFKVSYNASMMSEQEILQYVLTAAKAEAQSLKAAVEKTDGKTGPIRSIWRSLVAIVSNGLAAVRGGLETLKLISNQLYAYYKNLYPVVMRDEQGKLDLYVRVKNTKKVMKVPVVNLSFVYSPVPKLVDVSVTEYMPLSEYIKTVENSEEMQKFAEVFAKTTIALAPRPRKHTIEIRKTRTGADKAALTGASASYTTMITPLPLLEYTTPTYQYLGKGDTNILLNIQTKDRDVIKQLQAMNASCNHTRILREKLGAKTFRFVDTGIYVEENGFIRMLGIENVLVSSVSYAPVESSPGLYNIQLNLVDHTMDPRQYEVLRRTGLTSVNRHVDILKRLLFEEIDVAAQMRAMGDMNSDQIAKMLNGGTVPITWKNAKHSTGVWESVAAEGWTLLSQTLLFGALGYYVAHMSTKQKRDLGLHPALGPSLPGVDWTRFNLAPTQEQMGDALKNFFNILHSDTSLVGFCRMVETDRLMPDFIKDQIETLRQEVQGDKGQQLIVPLLREFVPVAPTAPGTAEVGYTPSHGPARLRMTR